MEWTPIEAASFEAAREVIGDYMAILSGKIAQERAKSQPDAGLIEQLLNERAALHAERDDLKIQDQERIASVRENYGKLVRACRSQAGKAA